MKLHGTRHFYAVALMSSGMDIAAVSKLVGHSSVKVTADVYGDLFEQSRKDAGQAVAALVTAHRRTAP